MKTKIKKLTAHEILDSRGYPTVEAVLVLDNGQKFKASVPSGASTGNHEALELRDGDKKMYTGQGVTQACKNIEEKIAKALVGVEITEQKKIDNILIKLAGVNKLKVGANTTLAVSLVCARAGAAVTDLELYEYIIKTYNFKAVNKYSLPIPMFNIFNGGKHADTNLDLQEFMVVPVLKADLREKIRIGAEIFHKLAGVLEKNDLDTDVGNEGGYAPNIDSTIQAIDLILEAITAAGYKPGQEVGLALDVGASELYNAEKKLYTFELDDYFMLSDQLIHLYRDWAHKYPIFSIEDGLAEDDWQGWKNLTQEFKLFKPLVKGQKMLLVGDDLVTTNVKRLEKAVKEKCANAVIVKPNQIGTLSETIDFVKLSQINNYRLIVSHRSGETTDDFVADLAVAVGADFCKFGSLSRGERVVKYNRLMEIEEKITAR